jgi:hypothetical protein
VDATGAVARGASLEAIGAVLSGGAVPSGVPNGSVFVRPAVEDIPSVPSKTRLPRNARESVNTEDRPNTADAVNGAEPDIPSEISKSFDAGISWESV